MSRPMISSRVDDWVNPIAVKEMRQAVNGRFIEWTLMAFLLIHIGVAASVLLFSEGFNTGRNLFMGHLAVLLATSLFYIPLSTGIRFSSERSEHNVDLFFITTLKPAQIIWGKTMAAIILMLLFFSAAMPFLTLTYLLRGLDIPSAFVLLALDSLVVTGCVQVSIFLACVPVKVISRGLLFALGLLLLIGSFVVTMQSSFGMLFLGIGSSIVSFDFWGPALTIGCFVLMAMGLLFVLSVALITPRSANKALGVRIYVSIIWLVSGIIAGCWSFITSEGGPIQAWGLGMVMLFGMLLFVSICERLEQGPRILRSIPRKRILRLPAFLFYSGAAGGVCFSVLFMMGTLLLGGLLLQAAPLLGIGVSGDKVEVIALGFAVYISGYCLSGLTIRRLFFSASQRANIALEIILVLMMLGEVAPLVIGYLLHRGSWDLISPRWYFGNPLAFFFEEATMIKFLPYAGGWAIVVAAVTLPWLFRQFQKFKPAVPARAGALQPDE